MAKYKVGFEREGTKMPTNQQVEDFLRSWNYTKFSGDKLYWTITTNQSETVFQSTMTTAVSTNGASFNIGGVSFLDGTEPDTLSGVK